MSSLWLEAGGVLQPDGAGVALVVLVAVDISADVGVVHQAAGGLAGDQRQVERLARLDHSLVRRHAADQRLERVLVALQQQVVAGLLNALSRQDDLELAAVDLADGVAEEGVQLAVGHVGTRILGRRNLDRVGQQAERLPIVRAGFPAVFRNLGGAFDPHAPFFALGMELVGQFFHELVELAAQILIQATIVDVDALVQVAYHQVQQVIHVGIALRLVHQQVGQQIGADDGAIVIADHRGDWVRRHPRIIEGRVDRPE